MPIGVSDLKPGERVLLYCAKARRHTRREAVFQGVYGSWDEALAAHTDGCEVVATLGHEPTANDRRARFARFLMQRVGDAELIGAFQVEPDGSLREDEGRRVVIEMRVAEGRG